MSTIQDRQLAAYRRIVALMNTPAYQAWVQHSPHTHCIPCEMQKIIDDVNLAEGELAHTIESIKIELARTRLKRLPSAQFMYLAMNGNPKIMRSGSAQYLHVACSVFDVPKEGAVEAISRIEHDLWNTTTTSEEADPEVKVFWKEWTISELTTTQYRISTHWAAAYLHFGYVYAERAEIPETQEEADKAYANQKRIARVLEPR